MMVEEAADHETVGRRIFLSYSRADRDRVNGLALLLEALGHQVFLDHRTIKPGMRWRAKLQEGLADADVLVVYWTRHAAESEWVRREVEAFHFGTPDPMIVPVLGDESPLTPLLSQYQHTDFAPLVNELLTIKTTMEKHRAGRRAIQRAILERLREAGIELAPSQHKKLFLLFAPVGLAGLIATPLLALRGIWAVGTQAAAQLTGAQAALVAGAALSGALIGGVSDDVLERASRGRENMDPVGQERAGPDPPGGDPARPDSARPDLAGSSHQGRRTSTDAVDVDTNTDTGILDLTGILAAGGEPVELEEWTVLGPPNDGGERQPLAVDYRQVNPQFELPEGAYLVRARLGSAGKEREVRVRTGEITTVMFNLEAGTLSLSAVLSAGQDPFSVHEWKILGPPDPLGDRASVEVGHSQTRPRFTLPEGRYLVQAVQGAAQAELEVAVRAGEDTVTQLDFRAGTLSLTAVRGSDQEPLRVSRWRIFQMPDLFGKRRRVATEYSQANPLFTLPEGDYWVLATHEESTVEQKVTVRAGEAAQVRLRLIDPD